MDQKHAILAKALEHIPFDGWTDSVLLRAVKSIGLEEGYAEILFPGGVADLLDLFTLDADAHMLEGLALLPLKEMKIRERIKTAIRLRLEYFTPNRAAVRRAITFSALPHHAGQAVSGLWRTADSIWHAAGDSSTDYNYYSKRLLLSGVYSSTLLYWLDDDSDHYTETYAFLDRRIADVMKIGDLRKMTGKLGEGLRKIPFIRLAFLQ